jgi:coproporphyrinogen III oxidase
MFESLVKFFYDLQDQITGALEQESGSSKFHEDTWTGEGWLAGGGRTRVMESGTVLERGGVNVSDVHGLLPDDLARNMPGKAREFRAAGISLVLHPLNPHAPTVHANFRIISRGKQEDPETIWFGGGADLTPMILYEEDATHFHSIWKKVCDRYPSMPYTKLKEDCDRYFYLPHRKEGRGIGGIFYDYVDTAPEVMGQFTREAGSSFLDAYLPLLKKRSSQSYTEEDREFQMWRRGRYVEFNLVYDRGTQFGLKTGGRIESILMSLPPIVRYKYDYRPAPGSRYEATMQSLSNPRTWV